MTLSYHWSLVHCSSPVYFCNVLSIIWCFVPLSWDICTWSIFVVCVLPVCVWFSSCFRMYSSGSVVVCFCNWFWRLLCCYLCWLDVLPVSGDQSPCLCDTYVIGSFMMVMITFCFYSMSTVPHPHVELLISGSTLVLSSFVCMFTSDSQCSSSLFILIESLLIIGIIPLIGQLNSIFAGIGSPGPSGVLWICNKAKCRSLFASKHF